MMTVMVENMTRRATRPMRMTTAISQKAFQIIMNMDMDAVMKPTTTTRKSGRLPLPVSKPQFCA
ncbi:hypothetical protein LDENG_00080160 [Lucifuga dentata]|nr:hypothetical protein LDENG_00080160 [Lucifuga dentata]